jgi:hypothetical protein
MVFASPTVTLPGGAFDSVVRATDAPKVDAVPPAEANRLAAIAAGASIQALIHDSVRREAPSWKC